MSFALLRYTGNNSTVTYSVSFAYRSTDDVIVSLDGVAQTITTHYTFPTSGQITFATAPGTGVIVEIKRSTSQSSRIVDYQAGSVIKETDLDNDSIQGFYMAQEAIDITEGALNKDSQDRYDATSKRIINVTDPTGDQDAATKTYVDTKFAADVASTAADVVSTNADVVLTNADVVSTNADVVTVAGYLDTFDDRYLGSKSSEPTVDNDGNTLLDGALYFNTTTNVMKVYDLGNTTWITIKPTTTEQGHITTVAGISSDVTTVAGKDTEIGRLGTADAVADMAILGTTDVVADMAILATTDVVTDMNTLGTADVVTDMNTLGTADVVSDMNTLATADIISDMNTLATSGTVTAMNELGTSANVTAMGLLGTSAVVTDMGLLGTSAVVTDLDAVADKITEIGRLGTADAVADMNTLGTADVVTDMNTLGTSANVTAMDTVSGSISNVNLVGGSIANVNTAATNITSIDTFAVRYRIGTTDPSTSLDDGDLFYNTVDNQMKFYDGSNWVALSADTDVKTKVSANDTTAGYLNGKLTAGANISLTEGSDGGNETLAIAVTGTLGGGNYLGNNGEIGASNADIIRVHSNTLNYSGTLTLESTENGLVVGPFSIAGSTVLDVQGTLVII